MLRSERRITITISHAAESASNASRSVVPWPSAIRKHPLTDQGRDLVLDQLRAPRVVKARRKPIHHRGLGDELKDSPKTTSD
jgi:hypothetical protein